HDMADFARRSQGRLHLVSKFHPKANLYQPPPRVVGKKPNGRPRKKGAKLPSPQVVVLISPHHRYTPISAESKSPSVLRGRHSVLVKTHPRGRALGVFFPPASRLSVSPLFLPPLPPAPRKGPPAGENGTPPPPLLEDAPPPTYHTE